jgi:autotransporter-associated beta strand protein
LWSTPANWVGGVVPASANTTLVNFGAAGITKAGAGRLTLSGTSTLAGGTGRGAVLAAALLLQAGIAGAQRDWRESRRDCVQRS